MAGCLDGVQACQLVGLPAFQLDGFPAFKQATAVQVILGPVSVVHF